MGDVKLLKRIGQGAFGTVFMGDRKGKQCAVKIILLNGIDQKSIKDAVKEGMLLEKLQHPNIVKFEGCNAVKGDHGFELHIIMEYCGGGDLYSNIKKQRATGTPFSEKQIITWFLDVNSAVEYLHSKGIIHRDIKPLNILKHNDGTIKLGDFGLAKILNSKKDLKASVMGTVIYSSPEMHLKSLCDFRGDMWSMGCTLYELAKLEPAFRSSAELIKYVQSHRSLRHIPTEYSDVLKHLITSLLQIDPKKRPTAESIAKNESLQALRLKNPQKQDSRSANKGTRSPVNKAQKVRNNDHDHDDKRVSPNLTKEPVKKDCQCRPRKEAVDKMRQRPHGLIHQPMHIPGFVFEPFQLFNQGCGNVNPVCPGKCKKVKSPDVPKGCCKE